MKAQTIRDLSRTQFEAALARHGFRREAFGYVYVGHGLSVYARNAGENRRAQLAYLIQASERAAAETVKVPCPACFGTEPDCDSCDGRGYFLRFKESEAK